MQCATVWSAVAESASDGATALGGRDPWVTAPAAANRVLLDDLVERGKQWSGRID